MTRKAEELGVEGSTARTTDPHCESGPLDDCTEARLRGFGEAVSGGSRYAIDATLGILRSRIRELVEEARDESRREFKTPDATYVMTGIRRPARGETADV